jgi:hypothetical protein
MNITKHLMKLVEEYRTAGGREEHWMRKDILEIAIDDLVHELYSKQEKIDALMLEYCPKDMTEEQLNRWKHNQAVLQSSI